MKTFWIGTGTRTIRQLPSGESNLLEPAMGQSVTEDIGVEVEADNLTIEPSGALTLWRSPDGERRSTLIMAFAPGNWTKAHLVSATLKPAT